MKIVSESETKSEHKNESVKVFVGQILKQLAKSELILVFDEFARADEVIEVRIRYFVLNYVSFRAGDLDFVINNVGCYFLTYPSKEKDLKAIAASHNKKTLPKVVCEGFLCRCVVIGIITGALSEVGASSRPLFLIASETMLLRFEQILFSRL